MSRKRSIMAKEEGVSICFLHTNKDENEFFGPTDVGCHPRLMKDKEMLSSAHVNAALTRTMDDTFSNKVRAAGKEDEEWIRRGRELVRLRESAKKSPVEWMEKDRLL